MLYDEAVKPGTLVLIKEPVISEGMEMTGIEDIAAMKLLAISRYGRKRDFFALWLLLKIFSLRELFDFFQKRHKQYSLITLTHSIAYFVDAEGDEDPTLLSEKVSWDEVKKKLQTELKLFHG